MNNTIKTFEDSFKKKAVSDVRSGDTVKVHQKIREGNKERVQVFEGLVIRTDRKNSHTASITVRRMSSGVGVEKSYLLHSPSVKKIEVVKRSKVRRKYLSYMRKLTGKSTRLSAQDFDKESVNATEADTAKNTQETDNNDQETTSESDSSSNKPTEHEEDKTKSTKAEEATQKETSDK